jgi:hypothetical protein
MRGYRGGYRLLRGGSRGVLTFAVRNEGGRGEMVDLYVNQSVKRRARYDRSDRTLADMAGNADQRLLR